MEEKPAVIKSKWVLSVVTIWSGLLIGATAQADEITTEQLSQTLEKSIQIVEEENIWDSEGGETSEGPKFRAFQEIKNDSGFVRDLKKIVEMIKNKKLTVDQFQQEAIYNITKIEKEKTTDLKKAIHNLVSIIANEKFVVGKVTLRNKYRSSINASFLEGDNRRIRPFVSLGVKKKSYLLNMFIKLLRESAHSDTEGHTAKDLYNELLEITPSMEGKISLRPKELDEIVDVKKYSNDIKGKRQRSADHSKQYKEKMMKWTNLRNQFINDNSSNAGRFVDPETGEATRINALIYDIGKERFDSEASNKFRLLFEWIHYYANEVSEERISSGFAKSFEVKIPEFDNSNLKIGFLDEDEKENFQHFDKNIQGQLVHYLTEMITWETDESTNPLKEIHKTFKNLAPGMKNIPIRVSFQSRQYKYFYDKLQKFLSDNSSNQSLLINSVDSQTYQISSLIAHINDGMQYDSQRDRYVNVFRLVTEYIDRTSSDFRATRVANLSEDVLGIDSKELDVAKKNNSDDALPSVRNLADKMRITSQQFVKYRNNYYADFSEEWQKEYFNVSKPVALNEHMQRNLYSDSISHRWRDLAKVVESRMAHKGFSELIGWLNESDIKEKGGQRWGSGFSLGKSDGYQRDAALDILEKKLVVPMIKELLDEKHEYKGKKWSFLGLSERVWGGNISERLPHFASAITKNAQTLALKLPKDQQEEGFIRAAASLITYVSQSVGLEDNSPLRSFRVYREKSELEYDFISRNMREVIDATVHLSFENEDKTLRVETLEDFIGSMTTALDCTNLVRRGYGYAFPKEISFQNAIDQLVREDLDDDPFAEKIAERYRFNYALRLLNYNIQDIDYRESVIRRIYPDSFKWAGVRSEVLDRFVYLCDKNLPLLVRVAAASPTKAELRQINGMIDPKNKEKSEQKVENFIAQVGFMEKFESATDEEKSSVVYQQITDAAANEVEELSERLMNYAANDTEVVKGNMVYQIMKALSESNEKVKHQKKIAKVLMSKLNNEDEEILKNNLNNIFYWTIDENKESVAYDIMEFASTNVHKTGKSDTQPRLSVENQKALIWNLMQIELFDPDKADETVPIIAKGLWAGALSVDYREDSEKEWKEIAGIILWSRMPEKKSISEAMIQQTNNRYGRQTPAGGQFREIVEDVLKDSDTWGVPAPE